MSEETSPAPAPFFSPAGLARRALWLLLLFGMLHLAGLRIYMSAMALTFPPGTSPEMGFFLCGLYLLFYLIALSVVPVLLIAAGLLAVWERAAREKKNLPESEFREGIELGGPATSRARGGSVR